MTYKLRRYKDIDLTGQTINMLSVIGRGQMKQPSGKIRHGWWCRCECKQVCFRSTLDLTTDVAYSCGCSKRGMYTHEQAHPLPQGAKIDPTKIMPIPVNG